MKMSRLLRTWLVFVFVCVTLTSAFNVLSGHTLNCSQQGLRCSATRSNCMDSGWLVSHEFTPSGPEGLQVSVETRKDDTGQLQPVLLADWKLKDDGGISFLKATELQVHVMSTNENQCIRYTFTDKLKMRNPSWDKWSFSSDGLVLEPGQSYLVSVYNIPKPEQGHTHYNVNRILLVPGCLDPKMQETQFCKERGSDWQPKINVSHVNSNNSLLVSFSPHALSQTYLVWLSCGDIQRPFHVHKKNQMRLDVGFNLDSWPKSCCQFDVKIKPSFTGCNNDCPIQKTTSYICSVTSEKQEEKTLHPLIFVPVGFVAMCAVTVVLMYVLCRKQGKPPIPPLPEKLPQPVKAPPKVLVIYSQDHYLYRDVVLKLCAFLQVKCGTRVLVDLLDTTSVSMVGRLRWLEWQRQQLKNPSDKILVLCSRGVQAKWRAMCGQGQVMLREDVLSPTDDMLIPFLNLFLPDLHQVGMLGKYMVAYFEDISSEKDVPSVFDIGIKYNLMKHFEELYFRILDIEKYQPGQINQIEGISGDEYFNCPSGSALKDAIETFHAYQLENPDWFEKECVDCEEEVIPETNQLIDQLQIPPVYERVLPVRDALPVFIQDMNINENCNSIHILTPELKPESHMSSVSEVLPVVNPEGMHQYQSSQVEVLTEPSADLQFVYIAEPVLNHQPPVQQNRVSLKQYPFDERPTEDDEEDSLLDVNQRHSDCPDQRCSVLHNSQDVGPPEASSALTQRKYFPSCEISNSQPVEMDEEDLDPSEKRSSSESDQGYISKASFPPEASVKEDPLVALARLQEELFQQNLGHPGLGPEENWTLTDFN